MSILCSCNIYDILKKTGDPRVATQKFKSIEVARKRADVSEGNQKEFVPKLFPIGRA